MWKIFTREFDFSVDHLKKNLSQIEINRAEKFYQEKDKNCYIVARSILKELLSLYIKRPICEIYFHENEYGKPYLVSEINDLSLQFNISHSNELIVLGFTLEKPIGIDAEYHKKTNDLSAIAEHVFSKKEFIFWNMEKEENKIRLFYDLWTCKESVIKAMGLGFSYHTQNFTVKNINEIEQNNKDYQNKKIIFHKKNDLYKKNYWSIMSINCKNDYSVACAVMGEVNELKCFDYPCRS